MRKGLTLKYLCLFCLWGFGKTTFAVTSTCPGTVSPPFCDTLQAMNEGDWAYCSIVFREPPSTDTVCDKTKQNCQPPPDTSSDSLPSYDYEYTQRLFETYDLRWPDDKEHRAPVPTVGGRRDTLSGQLHSPNGGFMVYATKSTILSAASESYVMWVQQWSPQLPDFLSHPRNQALNIGIMPAPYNIKGQRMPSSNSRTYLIQGPPVMPAR